MGHALEYPREVTKRLTTRFEVNEITNPGKVELWLHPSQKDMGIARAKEVFEELKQGGLRERSLSYGHLRWFENHPDQIPTEFMGKQIFGWGTIVRMAGQAVPYLDCRSEHESPQVGWASINWDLWLETMPAGLRSL